MLIINAKLRGERMTGKGASRRLRKNNKLPAVIYGGNTESISIELNHDEIISQENKSEFYEVLVLLLIINSNSYQLTAKIKAIQRHPFKPKFIHIDFLRL